MNDDKLKRDAEDWKEMTISREKCLEFGNQVYDNPNWSKAMIDRLEKLCNLAYQEGQKDMRERAAKREEAADALENLVKQRDELLKELEKAANTFWMLDGADIHAQQAEAAIDSVKGGA